jgi:hypothetical protein
MAIKITSEQYAGQTVAVNDSMIAFGEDGELLGVVAGPGSITVSKHATPIEARHLNEIKMRPKEFTVEVTEDEVPEDEKIITLPEEEVKSEKEEDQFPPEENTVVDDHMVAVTEKGADTEKRKTKK